VEAPVQDPKYKQNQVKVLGDSMLRGAGEHCKREGCDVSVYPGIRVHELANQLKMKTESESEPEVVVLHVGTNNIKRRSKVHMVAEIDELIDAGKGKWDNTKWVIGGLVYRDDVYATTIDKLNDGLQWLCEERGMVFYDPNSRISQREKAKDGLHLNHRGGLVLGQLLMEKIDEALTSEKCTTK
jgi:lysophospholipase L1-like esterase